MYYASGDKYSGNFVLSKMQGNGNYFWQVTGNTYEGGWLNNLSHGYGIMSYG